MTPALAFCLVSNELQRAQARFQPFASDREGHSVIEEEYDEFWEDVKKNQAFFATLECIQLAAMSVRYLVDCCDQETGEKILRETTKPAEVR